MNLKINFLFLNLLKSKLNKKLMNYKQGWIKVVCGPVKSGKSKFLFFDIDYLKHANIPFLIFKIAFDTRSEDSISSRYLSQKKIGIVVKTSEDILKYINENNIQVPCCLLIDEVQFYDKEIAPIVKELSKRGFSIYLYGLDTDSNWTTFGNVGQLMSIAHEVKKMKSICYFCKADSSKTISLEKQNKNKGENIVIVVGEGSDIFSPACDKCYFEKINNY